MRTGIDAFSNSKNANAMVVRIKISTIPKFYFDNANALSQTYTSLEAAFLEPLYSASNIKNGYGNFYSKHSITLTYKL